MNDKRLDRAIALMLAIVILVMIVTCQTGNAQIHGATPEPVNIGDPEHIMVCWVIDGADTTEECVSMPNGMGLNESEVQLTCDKVKADVKRVVPDAIITKCGLMRDWM